MKYWERAILLVDMNACFASIEQNDFPELRGMPVGVTNGLTGTCIITCSYEARAYGIKTGMRVKEAIECCPHFIRRPARPKRYATVSTQIMNTLSENVSPEMEVFSVDEAFLDVTSCQQLLGTPERIGKIAKNAVLKASGLLCSVGVSGDKTTAKWAAKQNKPDGLTVVPPWLAEQTLEPVPVQELCGIANGVQRFLNERGVFVCGDMKQLPISVLGQRFGNIGRRIWLMAQGKDPEPLHPIVNAPKSIGHGKVLPPETKDLKTLITYLTHMSEKVAYRLRLHNFQAQQFFIGLRLKKQWLKTTTYSGYFTQDGKIISLLCSEFLHQFWRGQGVYAVQVTALKPTPVDQQLDMFHNTIDNRDLNQVMDVINQRYGQYTLTRGRLMERSNMPDVIAPAWKPTGHRQTI